LIGNRNCSVVDVGEGILAGMGAVAAAKEILMRDLLQVKMNWETCRTSETYDQDRAKVGEAAF